MTGKRNGKLTAVLALKTEIPAMKVPEEMIDEIINKFPEVSFRFVNFHPTAIDGLGESEILYAYTITPELFASSKKLQWFHSVVTGPDFFIFPELVASGIHVTSPRGVYSIPVAETALGLMFALARRIHNCISLQPKSRWAALDVLNLMPPQCELEGATVVIAGIGGIGSALAKRCRCMGMRVIGVVASSGRKSPFVDELIEFDRMKDVIGRADFLVLACPLTARTRGMIGADEIAMMKPTSFLINIARGALVDEGALIEALKTHSIAGAAADAFTIEPLPNDHPFFSLPNMIVTPHISGLGSTFWKRAFERFTENLENYLGGKPLVGEVNFVRGY